MWILVYFVLYITLAIIILIHSFRFQFKMQKNKNIYNELQMELRITDPGGAIGGG
jgi:hypothetical protein